MIIIYHKNYQVKEIWDDVNCCNISISYENITIAVKNIANIFPNDIIVWADVSAKKNINFTEIKYIFVQKNNLISYNPSTTNFLSNKIGYVNESIFINVYKQNIYPTWQMSSYIGAIHAEIILTLQDDLFFKHNFDYFLNSIAKLSIPLGLLCYSNPNLLIEKVKIKSKIANNFILFRFVKQHQNILWIFLLFFNFLIYEGRLPILPFINSLFYKKRKLKIKNFNSFNTNIKNQNTNIDLDVIIPSIGRKKYLYNVLENLQNQSILPKNVIIVEQNPSINGLTELDYLTTKKWPFRIKHVLINKAGVCNARNIAIELVTSEWVFFADDDIELENNFLEKAFQKVNQFSSKAFTFNCYQNIHQKNIYKNDFQWDNFGSGCSIIKSELLKSVKFNIVYEFGFGEDADFGIQIRKNGNDVIYLSEPRILHFKAPIGGFRTKPILAWHNDEIQPKPSPTIMINMLKNSTKEQLLGYKTTLFIKYYKLQSIKNPVKYYSMFHKQWNRSIFWANELLKKS